MAALEKFGGPDCEAGALEGIRAVLRARLDEMCNLRAAGMRWEEIEGVHRMRVAVRALARRHKRETGGFFERMLELLREAKAVESKATVGRHETDEAVGSSAGSAAAAGVTVEPAPAVQ